MRERVGQIARLFDHVAWADAAIARAIALPGVSAETVHEYAHVAGAEEVWLSRVEGRPSRTAVWPDLNAAQATELAVHTAEGFRHVLDSRDDTSIDEPVTYTNSAGLTFTTPLSDILLHVALHGQYHRGKINQLLRQSGLDPAPVDFIAFVRGVPAATRIG